MGVSKNFINILGVLTKPDRIPTGEETNWIPFIRNEKETLENNWYCVKQPSSSDIKTGITWSQARQREQDFFAMTPPWSELDAVYQKYLKTYNLVERLSSILSDLISKRSLNIFHSFLPVSYSSSFVISQAPGNSRWTWKIHNPYSWPPRWSSQTPFWWSARGNFFPPAYIH